MAAHSIQPPIKDREREHPVASVWRPVFHEIVKAFVKGDYALDGIPGVVPVAPNLQEHIQGYIKDYGETLVELSDETWKTSVAQWVDGFWDVIVDLWTKESGCSDMIVQTRVFEEPEGSYRYEVHLVYVP